MMNATNVDSDNVKGVVVIGVNLEEDKIIGNGSITSDQVELTIGDCEKHDVIVDDNQNGYRVSKNENGEYKKATKVNKNYVKEIIETATKTNKQNKEIEKEEIEFIEKYLDTTVVANKKSAKDNSER